MALQAEIVRSRILVRMRELPAFSRNNSAPRGIELEDAEEVVGRYVPESQTAHSLYFTTRALYLETDGKIECLEWTSITDYEKPDSKEDLIKTGATTLATTRGSRLIRMDVRGTLVDACSLQGLILDLNR